MVQDSKELEKPNRVSFPSLGEEMQTLDLFTLGLLFEMMISIPIYLFTSLIFMKLIDLISNRLGKILRYLAFPGIVLHEVCHDLFCRLTGVPIIEHRIFIGKQDNISGGVVIDQQKVRSFTTGFLIGFAPLIILAIGLYLLFVFWSFLPMQEVLKYYFAFCFFIGLSPSKSDVRLVTTIAKRRPKQTLQEMCFLSFPLLAGFIYLMLCSTWSLIFSIWVFIGLIAGNGLVALATWYLIKILPKFIKTNQNPPPRDNL